MNGCLSAPVQFQVCGCSCVLLRFHKSTASRCREHWMLVVANTQSRQVCVLNSINSPKYDTAASTFVDRWKSYMKMRSKKVERELADWETCHVPCRQQADGSSCRIFVLMVNLSYEC